MSSTLSLLIRPRDDAAAMRPAGSPVWMCTRTRSGSPTTSADSPSAPSSVRIASTSSPGPLSRNSVQYPQPCSRGATAAAPRRDTAEPVASRSPGFGGSRSAGSPDAADQRRRGRWCACRRRPARSLRGSPRARSRRHPRRWHRGAPEAGRWCARPPHGPRSTTRSRTTRMSSVSAAAAAAAAASRTTVRMVPSVGFITARYATADASLIARATPRGVEAACAAPTPGRSREGSARG